MDSSEEDQRLEHHRQPPHFLDLDELYKATGVEYFKVSINFWKKMGNVFEDVMIKLQDS
jgi:1,2-dihydroxy-3-keto-5-methylthiopentene dioxygenase